MTAKDLNLDCMSRNELWAIWQKTNCVRPIAFARELFPDRPRNYVQVTKSLGAYACNKAVAMGMRLEGSIATAIVYENICDRIYQGLPEWARGW